MNRRTAAIGAITLLLALSGCGGADSNVPRSHASVTPGTVPPVAVPTTLTITSSEIDPGQSIPVRFTCDGEGTSPPLAWSGASSDAAAYALVVSDPDAPDGTFYHWVVVDIPPETTSVPAGEAPHGGTQTANSADSTGYTPPCPPHGTHRYRFTVYALAANTGLSAAATPKKAVAAISAQAIARGRLTATYRSQAG